MDSARGRGTGIFSVPPLEDIKKARNVSAEKGPTLFKSTTSHLQTARDKKELSSVTQDSTESSAAVHIRTAGKSDSRAPDAKEGGNAEVIRTDGTKGGGTILQNEANSRKSVALHNSSSLSHPHVGAQTSSAGSSTAGSSNSKSTNIPGQAQYRTKSGRTVLNQSQQRNVPADNAGVGTGAATGGALESDLVVSTATESSSSASAATTAPAGSHGHPHAILTNPVQKNNPVMKHIRNVPWELGDIVPDFVLGRTTCALFLSVRYHSLHPDYIHARLKLLGKQYELRVLLVLVDVTECQKALSELAKIALLADLTLVLAWSYEEAGRYLETYKAYENKPPDLLMERVDSDSSSRVTECLTTVKKVNKTDAATLLNTFKTMDEVITASREELTLCPGLGPQKAQRLHDLFHEPFIPSKKPKLEL